MHLINCRRSAGTACCTLCNYCSDIKVYSIVAQLDPGSRTCDGLDVWVTGIMALNPGGFGRAVSNPSHVDLSAPPSHTVPIGTHLISSAYTIN